LANDAVDQCGIKGFCLLLKGKKKQPEFHLLKPPFSHPQKLAQRLQERQRKRKGSRKAEAATLYRP
jgi:hypothetical protein